MIVHFLLQSSSRDYTFLISIIYVFACKHICSKLYLVDELVRVSARFEAWDNPCHLCSGFGMHTAYSIIYDHILPKRIIYDHIFQSYMFNFLKGVYSRGSSIMFCLRVPIFYLKFFFERRFLQSGFLWKLRPCECIYFAGHWYQFGCCDPRGVLEDHIYVVINDWWANDYMTFTFYAQFGWWGEHTPNTSLHHFYI